MLKKVIYSLFILFSVCLFNIDVYAGGVNTNVKVNAENSDIECVYANGVVVGVNYDQSAKKRTAYVKEYPVNQSVVIDFESLSNISLFNEEEVATSIKYSCPSQIYYWIAYDPTSDGSRAYRGVYHTSSVIRFSSAGMSYNIPVTSKLIVSKTTGWWFWENTEVTSGVIPVKFRSTSENSVGSNCGDDYVISGQNVVFSSGEREGQACQAYAQIGLVAERIYITGDIGTIAYGHTLKSYGGNQEEAVGQPKYAQLYITDGYGDGKYLLQVGKTITSVTYGDAENINQYSAKGYDVYACIKESLATQDASRGESVYKFSSKRNEISSVKNVNRGADPNVTCGAGEALYKVTTETCKIKPPTGAGSFCEKYSNIAFVLVDIIQVAQILVPALVIVLTGIEIGRIVLAGNIEEELPKRKKNIIIRFVIMVAFFFLPLITKLIISLAEGVSIYDVECLFNNGVTEKNTELSEKDCVDVDSDQDDEATSKDH